MKVNFIIIGAMKSGTSTLAEILSSHPDVSFSHQKEPHFFSKVNNWREAIDEYHKLFDFSKKAIGEGSTTYTFYPNFNLEIWKDIYEYNSSMKFIYIIREPISRAVSQYMHMYERGYIDSTLEEALRREPLIINNGRYYTQLKPYIEQFGKENILILKFEDLVKQKKQLVKKVADFLELDFSSFKSFETTHANKTLNGQKKHHKYDQLTSLQKFIKRCMPKRLWVSYWNHLTDNSERVFKKKPILPYEVKMMIYRMTEIDLVKLEEVFDIDLAGWKVEPVNV